LPDEPNFLLEIARQLFDFFGKKLGMALNEENYSKRARRFGLWRPFSGEPHFMRPNDEILEARDELGAVRGQVIDNVFLKAVILVIR
jgi:hypothetical protein